MGSCELTCLDVSHDGAFAISGEAGRRARARVWDPSTGRELAALPIAHAGGIRHVAFAAERKAGGAAAGRSALSVGIEAQGEASLAVYASASGRWGDARFVARTGLDGPPPLFALFCNLPEFQIVTGGNGSATFWRLSGVSHACP
jgi:hypothetical protein